MGLEEALAGSDSRVSTKSNENDAGSLLDFGFSCNSCFVATINIKMKL